MSSRRRRTVRCLSGHDFALVAERPDQRHRAGQGHHAEKVVLRPELLRLVFLRPYHNPVRVMEPSASQKKQFWISNRSDAVTALTAHRYSNSTANISDHTRGSHRAQRPPLTGDTDPFKRYTATVYFPASSSQLGL